MPSAPVPSPSRLVHGAAASACVVLLLTVVGGALTPGSSHLSMYISELGARGAPLEWPVRIAGFLPAGLLMLGVYLARQTAVPTS